MSYAEYQKHFEEMAKREQAEFDRLSLSELTARVKTRKFGSTYQIWYAIVQKATVKDVGWVLFDILESETDHLTRYHCAAALLTLFNPFPDVMKPEKLSGKDAHYVDQHLKEMKEALTQHIGPRK